MGLRRGVLDFHGYPFQVLLASPKYYSGVDTFPRNFQPSLLSEPCNQPQSANNRLTASLFFRQSCKGELLKLAGSLLLVYGRDVPELAEGVKTMLGWCDGALSDNAKNQQVNLVYEML